MSKTFKVENYKGCKTVELSPEGSLAVIAGPNGAGKSSFIDAIRELIDPKGTRLTPKPIRDGEKKAVAEYVDTELDVRIVRTWTKDDAGKLEVTALDGAKHSKPTELLAKLTGGLIFDPSEFLRKGERDQRQALLEAVDLPFDLDAVDAQRKAAAERRTEASREEKRLRGAFQSTPNPTPGTPAAEVSSSELLAQIQDAQDAQRWNAQIAEAYDAATIKVEELESQLVTAREQLADATHAMKTSIRPVSDVAAMREQLAQIDETNAAVRTRKAWEKARDEWDAARDAHAETEKALAAIDAAKADGLAQAKFPVDGLTVTEDGIALGGVPFSQVNSATRLRVALAIATAGDADLRLVIMKEGDLLDADSLRMVQEIAAERGYTVLVERDRDESRQIGFTIIDGELEGAQAPATYERRVQVDMGCSTCRLTNGEGPFHEAHPDCPSGGRNHCSCEVCF